ncbi:hypothetical protein SAMN06269173_10361 [Hymenobacter mucosus]|uniref:DUF2199 domain-containing protein n=2 Tax=Hymenobacteraceae TaxID=1853232 RepID=A0A238WTF5_9BACT|nr:hypothetical protein SAMN06269173_10361 [Hymenobacter mucosus]
MCFGADFPDFYFSVPPAERTKRVELTRDLCVVDEEHFFIRARIEIPVHDSFEPLCWNVWTSLSETNFIRANEVWNEPDRVNEPPYFGWLQTVIPGYADTLNIRTLVHTQPVGTIPRVEVIEANHPLTLDQQHGISMDRVIELVTPLLH